MLVAGARTFPMLALAGFTAAMLAAEQQSSVAFAVPLLVIGALLVVSYMRTTVHGGLGMTDDTILAFFYRHERAARIYDGADEVHKISAARQIL